MRTILALALALLLAACSEIAGPRTPIERGRQVYTLVCSSCHGSDPREAGTLGPDIAGSSRELLAARVVRGEYPPGYTPKRATDTMTAFPHLAPRIDDLFAFLQHAQQPPATPTSEPRDLDPMPRYDARPRAGSGPRSAPLRTAAPPQRSTNR